MVKLKHCVYGNCKNISRENNEDDVYFVPFPKPLTARTRSLMEKWVKACGRKDLTVLRVQTEYIKCFVCSSHFVGGDGPTKLNPDPIQFVPEEPLQVQLFRNRKFCVVTDCDSMSSQDTITSFHSFPKHHLQLALWKAALKLRDDPPKSQAFVCSKHFISGMKSNVPSHPDFIPSIFPSTCAAEVKALRQKLKEFEGGFARNRMERNCASLRRHWFECGFSRKELLEGVNRVKSQKRKQAKEEQLEAEEKKKRKVIQSTRSEESESMPKVKEEVEGGDEEFIIENDRAEECVDENEEEFDLSRVKEEPVSDTESSVKTKDNIGDSIGPSSDDNTVSKVQEKQSTSLLAEKDVKTEPVDKEYDKAESPDMGDICDEMLTVHFGNQDDDANGDDDSDGVGDSDGGMSPENMGDLNNTVSQLSNTNQSLMLQRNQDGFVGQTVLSNQKFVHPVTISTQNLGYDPALSTQNASYPFTFPTQNLGFQTTLANQNLGYQPALLPQNVGYQTALPAHNQGLPSNFYSVFGQTYQFLNAQSSGQRMNYLQSSLTQPYIASTVPTNNLAENPTRTVFALNPKHYLSQTTNHSACSVANPVPLNPVYALDPNKYQYPEASNNSVEDPVKTVFALDPHTYQYPVTGQTKFVVPKENVISLEINGSKSHKERQTGNDEAQIGKADTRQEVLNPECSDVRSGQSENEIEEEELLRIMNDNPVTDLETENQETVSRTPSAYSEPGSHLMSCGDDSRDSLHSSDYVPSDSESDTSTEGYRPGSCDIESVGSGMVVKKSSALESDTSSQGSFVMGTIPGLGNNGSKKNVQKVTKRYPLQKTLSADSDSRGSSNSVTEVQNKDRDQPSADSSCQTEPSSDQYQEGHNSKMSQTKPSISKEATLKRHLENIGVQVTPLQFGILLRQTLYASGMSPAIQRVKKWYSNCAVQADMDMYLIPDLKQQCSQLAGEVYQHKQKIRSMTYDFLECGTSKANVLCHTGCYTIETMKALFEYTSICLDSPPLDELSQFQEFVMTLMKIRLGLHNFDLAFRFEVLPSVVPDILTKWVNIFMNALSHLIEWPDQEPERTEHRNQRWRLLKLRYDLLQAYDCIESKKDKWLLEQDLDEMIKICDVLNSFQIKEQTSEKSKVPKVPDQILPEPVSYFLEEIVVEEDSDDESSMNDTEDENPDSETKKASDKSDEVCLDKDIEDEGDTSEKVSEESQGLAGASEEPEKTTNTDGQDETKDSDFCKEGQEMKSSNDTEKESNQESSDSLKTGPDIEIVESEGGDGLATERDGQNRVEPESDSSEVDVEKILDSEEGIDRSSTAESRLNCNQLDSSKESDSSKVDVERILDSEEEIDRSPTEESRLNCNQLDPSKVIVEDIIDSEVELDRSSTEESTSNCNSPDIVDMVEDCRQQRITKIIYVDDSDKVLIGAPELEVEIGDSELDVSSASTPMYLRF